MYAESRKSCRTTKYSSKHPNAVGDKKDCLIWVTLSAKMAIRWIPNNIQAVADWPKPQTLTELQQFLGLINKFRKYIQPGSTTCQHHNALDWSAKETGCLLLWTSACSDAFKGFCRVEEGADLSSLKPPLHGQKLLVTCLKSQLALF